MDPSAGLVNIGVKKRSAVYREEPPWDNYIYIAIDIDRYREYVRVNMYVRGDPVERVRVASFFIISELSGVCVRRPRCDVRNIKDRVSQAGSIKLYRCDSDGWRGEGGRAVNIPRIKRNFHGTLNSRDTDPDGASRRAVILVAKQRQRGTRRDAAGVALHDVSVCH